MNAFQRANGNSVPVYLGGSERCLLPHPDYSLHLKNYLPICEYLRTGTCMRGHDQMRAAGTDNTVIPIQISGTGLPFPYQSAFVSSKLLFKVKSTSASYTERRSHL